MNSRRTFLKRAAGVTAAAITFPGIVRSQNAPVRIGFSLAKTGIFAAAIPSQSNAYELWKDQLNAQGGLDLGSGRRPIEYVSYDDQSNPGQAAKIYERLISQDKVDLLLAPWGTPTHIAIAPVVERFRFPVVGNSAASAKLRDLKPGNIWFVTAAFPDRVGSELAAMLKAHDIKSVAILTNVLPYSKEVKSALEPALKAAGIEVRVNEEYPPDITDMTAMLARVKQAKPDGVLALSYPSDSVLYTRQAREAGITAPFQFVMIGPAADFFPKALGPAADNIVTVGHWTPKRNAAAAAFNQAYIAKFKERPDYLDSIDPYVSCEVLQQAVKVAGLDKDKLRNFISSNTFETINGPVKFTGVENLLTKTGFLQLQGGVPELVWPASDATAKFQPKAS